MSEKTFRSRIMQKCDTELNWKKAVNFIPKKGEIIIYEAGPTEETTDGQILTTDYVRIKIGDGETKVNNLSFFSTSTAELEDRIQALENIIASFVSAEEGTFGG